MVTFTKKRVAAVTVALVLVGGGMAFAYWTGDGDGTGTAATGTNADVEVIQTSDVIAMGPGDAPQDLSGNFNNDNDGPTYVGTVTASIGSITGGGVTCEATDYTLVNPVSTVDAEVPSGDAMGSWGTTDTPTIQFNNKVNEDQDDCKGATVNLAYAVS